LGTIHTGLADFKIAHLVRDQRLIPEVQRMARHIHDSYPSNAKAIIQRWVGEKDVYSNA
jgi:ATP-dependent DNA helicase RecG